MTIIFGPYFAVIAISGSSLETRTDAVLLGWLAATTLVQVSILGGGHLFFRRKLPTEAKMPPDERDIEIERHSIRIAYYALITGMIIVGCIMPFSHGGWQIVNAALFMIIISQIIHHGATVLSYRRQES